MARSCDIQRLSLRRAKADAWARKFSRASLSYDDTLGTLNKFSGYLYNCSKELTFSMNHDSTPGALVHGFFCRNRFCPLCNYYKSIRESTFIRSCLDDFDISKLDIFICDFTFQNPVSDLKEHILTANKCLRSVLNNPVFKDYCVGFVRKFEMTYNSNIKSQFFGTFHPHYHFLFCFPKGFKDNNFDFYKNELVPRWICALKKKGIYADIKAQNGHWFFERSSRSDSSIGLAVEEVVKAVDEVVQYTAKEDPLKIPDDKLLEYVYACKDLKRITYSGFFMDYRKKLLSGELKLGKLPVNFDSQNIHFAQLGFLDVSLVKISPSPELLPSSSLQLISYRFYSNLGIYVEFDNEIYHDYVKSSLPGWLKSEYRLSVAERVNDILSSQDEYIIDPLFVINKNFKR